MGTRVVKPVSLSDDFIENTGQTSGTFCSRAIANEFGRRKRGSSGSAGGQEARKELDDLLN